MNVQIKLADKGKYEEKLETTVDGPKMVFRFNNGDRQEQ